MISYDASPRLSAKINEQECDSKIYKTLNDNDKVTIEIKESIYRAHTGNNSTYKNEILLKEYYELKELLRKEGLI